MLSASRCRSWSPKEWMPLSFGERAGVQTHLMMCRGCRNFAAQIKFLREALRRQRDAGPAEEPLPGT